MRRKEVLAKDEWDKTLDSCKGIFSEEMANYRGTKEAADMVGEKYIYRNCEFIPVEVAE